MRTSWNTEVCWPAASADRARPDCTILDTCTHLFGSLYSYTVTTAFIFCFSRLMYLSPWLPQSREPFVPFLVNILENDALCGDSSDLVSSITLFMLFVFLSLFKSCLAVIVMIQCTLRSLLVSAFVAFICYHYALMIYLWAFTFFFRSLPCGLPPPPGVRVHNIAIFVGSNYLLFQGRPLPLANENWTLLRPLVLVARGGRQLQTGTIVQANVIVFFVCARRNKSQFNRCTGVTATSPPFPHVFDLFSFLCFFPIVCRASGSFGGVSYRAPVKRNGPVVFKLTQRSREPWID